MKVSSMFEQGTRTATIEFVPGVQITVKYLGQVALRGLINRATVPKFVRGQGRINDIDQGRFAKELAGFVVGWEGMTLQALSEFTVIKDGADMEAEIPFSRETCADLIENLPPFSQWVQNEITEPTNFNTVTEEELGNSPSGSNGDSPTSESPAKHASRSTKSSSAPRIVESAPSQS